jgi:transcription elongation factor GreB
VSKAFLKESDLPDQPELPRRVAPLPAGAPNYLTAAGAGRLQGELEQLERNRPALASAVVEDSEAKYSLQVLDRRMQDLRESLRTAQVVAPSPGAQEVVRFGARVTVRDPKGEESTYRLVGVDETEHARENVSWLSPLARALLNARLGQTVAFQAPAGKRQLEVVRILNE